MKKKLVRLTESDLHRIIKESVNRVLKEWNRPHNYDEKVADKQMYDAYKMPPNYDRTFNKNLKKNSLGDESSSMDGYLARQNAKWDVNKHYVTPEYKRAEIEDSWEEIPRFDKSRIDDDPSIYPDYNWNIR